MPERSDKLRDRLIDETLALPSGAGPAGAAATPPLLPDRIGAYRVVRLIGEGGMGTVYECIRDDDQFRKQVAIKLVRGSARTEPGVRRFRQERQILADLEHPNIARLLDGGSTTDGLPFLVMEFIEGEPITTYCASHSLSVPDRLNLFRQVCEPVQYAHQNLIVHRDLKPSNILVTSSGEPKLLDFGIAKLLDPETDGEDARTETRTAMAMTPDYASPEQVRGDRVSASSDVYSLGAVLYELITGHRPHQLKNYDPGEIARQVCQAQLKPPSEWGNGFLRGDLDTIVIRAMDKDPARRYNSVAQFSEDVHRHLEGLPILARPDTFAYRAGKFVGRHRLGIGALAAVALALSAGMAVAITQARVAEERFNEVRTLANRFLFDFHDSIAEIEGTTKAREMVVATALEYLDRLSRSAGRDRLLQRELAAAYVKVARVEGFPGEPNLGRIAAARTSLEKAVQLFDRSQAETPAEVESAIEALSRLAFLESDQENFEKSLYWSTRALALATSFPLDRMTPSLAKTYALIRARMTDSLEGKGDSEAAYQAARDAERIFNQYAAVDKSGSFDRRPRSLLVSLENAARLSGRLEEAMAVLEELLRKQAPSRETINYHAARASEIYASVDEPSWNDPAKALPLVVNAVKGYEQSLRTDPNDVNTRHALAVNNSKIAYYLLATNPREAARALEYTIGLVESLARQDPANSEFPDRLTRYRARMALVRSYLRQRTVVETLVAKVLDAGPRSSGQRRLHLLNMCSLSLANVGNRSRATEIFDEATRLASKLIATEGRRMSALIEATRAFEQQAEFLRQSGDIAAALRLVEQSRRYWQGWEPATTYVLLRRADSGRLLAAIRTGTNQVIRPRE